MLRVVAVALASLALLVHQAAATPLALVSEFRYWEVKYCNYFCDLVNFRPASPFAPLDATATFPTRPATPISPPSTWRAGTSRSCSMPASPRHTR